MTDLDLTTVPGNHPTGRAALTALVRISAAEGVLRDALLRANHMASVLRERLNELHFERADCLSAIDLFADIAPMSLGGSCVQVQPSEEAVAVEASLSQIELDVREVLAGMENKKGGGE